ncbi:hypothetical protein GCM10022277_18520 [Litoribacillus peritrichatus]|uniref:Uncharacterized protein n=2 Tax=Litoribacillus peritrichatus TaxID=718191 RepID=A0ABP7MH61_9GAMM
MQAYDRQWFSYRHVVRRDYFTLDSDLFKYLKYDWYIEAKGGDFKTLISDSIYVLQKSGEFKQYVPEAGPSGHISVYDANNKIYLVLEMQKELVTDCYGYFSEVSNFKDRNRVIDFVGEYNLKTRRFYLTHFMPSNTHFKHALRDKGTSHLDIIREILPKALPLICSEDVTEEQLRKQYDALWD